MTNLLFIIVAIALSCSEVFGQGRVHLINETGTPIDVLVISYRTDSTAYVTRIVFTDEKSKYSPSHSDRLIRTDIVAIAVTDTVFSKSINPSVGGGSKTVRIRNGKLSMKEPIVPTPRLRVVGSNFLAIFKRGDRLNLKLNSNEKVKGTVLSYSRNSISILSKNGNVQKVMLEDLKAIRETGYYYTTGPRIHLFPWAKYTEIEDLKFEFVRYFDNDSEHGWKLVE